MLGAADNLKFLRPAAVARLGWSGQQESREIGYWWDGEVSFNACSLCLPRKQVTLSAVSKLAPQKKISRPLLMVGLLLVLMLSWVLWSGIYKPLLLGLGLFSVLLSLWLVHRMGFFSLDIRRDVVVRLPGFCFWLLKEVIKSSVAVARIVLTPSLPISPTTVELDTSELSDMGKVILGNSITLTPGTVTIDVHENRLLVHCLTREGAEDLQGQEAQRRTAELERD